jgi:D-sedoheptulose 7-phosphate isomerase|tara:strand:- start:289 stop:885 length:597 start_codon:yes stop_codon:yes gene_type:complete
MGLVSLDQYILEVKDILDNVNHKEVESFIESVNKIYQSGKRIYLIGNGGSASAATHFAQDLSKGTITDPLVKPRIYAISLCDNISFITATSNDESYDDIFVNQLISVNAEIGDMLIAISCSGNSKNVIKAVDWAEQQSITVWGFTSMKSEKNELSRKYDCVHVPNHDVGTVEGVHSVIFHYIMAYFFKSLPETVNANI